MSDNVSNLWAGFDSAAQATKKAAWAPTYELVLACKECREYPANIIEDYSSGDTICGSCGLVLGEHMVDTRSEWRTFTGDDDNGVDPNRCGDAASALLDGNQLETMISFESGSAANRVLKRAHKKSNTNTTNKILLAAYSDISAYCDSMSLGMVVADTAKDYFKQAHDSKVARGRDTTSVIATCIFLACRHCKIPRTFQEVMSITKQSKKDIARTFKVLSAFFQKMDSKKAEGTGVSVIQTEGSSISSSTTTFQSMIPRVCDQLGLPFKSQKLASELMEKVQRLDILGGRGPSTVVAVVIYIVCHLIQQQKSIKEVCEPCGITADTARTAYKELYRYRERLVGQDQIRFLPNATRLFKNQ